MKRLVAHFEGRVQGVGFRYTTREVAEGFNVTGYVRNLPDGSVEMVAEGEESELDRFLTAVEESMRGYIKGTASHKSPATAEFAAFEIAG